MNVYAKVLDKAVKVESEPAVKDGFVFPAVVLGVSMFICGVIVIAVVAAKLWP